MRFALSNRIAFAAGVSTSIVEYPSRCYVYRMAAAIWTNAQERKPEFFSSVRDMELHDIPDRLRAAGKNQADLARFLRLDPSSLTKTIKGERRLKADELLRMEEFFGVEHGELGQVEQLGARRANGPRRIPVFGYVAAGGEERIAFNSGQIADWIDAPPLWTGTGDLIAVRVLGDSMEPRLFAGELVIAQIGLPPQRERDCIIEFNNGCALLKTYRGQKQGRVFAHQWNPEKEISFDGSSVKAIHAVIWRR